MGEEKMGKLKHERLKTKTNERKEKDGNKNGK